MGAPSRLARFVLFQSFTIWGTCAVDDFSNETASWIEESIGGDVEIELELGSLIAAATDWTEDETEIDDLVSGLVETGSIELQIG